MSVLLSPVVVESYRPMRLVHVVVGGTAGAAAFTENTGLWDVAYGWTASAGLQFAHVLSLVTCRCQIARERWRKLRVHQEAHVTLYGSADGRCYELHI